MKLIINADDFGMTKSVNKAIIELLKLGAISSTTVMVNMPYSNEVVDLLEIPNISIGWHVNITEGKSILPPSEIPSLVDKNGYYHPKDEFLRLLKSKEINFDELKAELYAQYKKLKELVGNKLCHFDSHQGSLRVPIVYKALVDIVKEEQIKVPIRIMSKYYLLNADSKPLLLQPTISRIKQFGVMRVLKEIYFRHMATKRKKHFYIPDGMIYNANNDTLSLLEDLIKLKEIPSNDVVLEISCHPAKDIIGLDNTKMTDIRVDEYNLLSSKKHIDKINEIGLLSFNDLCKV